MTDPQHILVVEDDPLVAEVVAAALDDVYAVTIVESAGEAIALLQRGGLRLMLLDCTLPGGIDPNLLPEADRQGTPVILMSGDSGRVAALSDRPRPFLLKPFTLNGLQSMVESVLSS